MFPIFKPFMPEGLQDLSSILYSGALAYNKWGKAFESDLIQYLNVNYLLTTNSYNSAMLVLISALGLKPNDTVLASPMSCLASNQPFITKGLKVKWVDVDPATGTMDPEKFRLSITKEVKAIFHNHHCGIPGYIDEINKIAKEHGIFVIDDCIEAFGSKYKGNIIGNTGADASIYSFQAVRLPNTIDGGAIAFNNAELYDTAKKVRDYGIDRSHFRDVHNEINENCDITIEGYGALMSEPNSYIGCKQMIELPLLLEKQRENGEIWKAKLESRFPDVNFLGFRNDISPNFWVFSLLTEKKADMLQYFRTKGFYASGIHVSNDIYSVFGKQAELKGVKDFATKHLALPSGWWIDEIKFKS